MWGLAGPWVALARGAPGVAHGGFGACQQFLGLTGASGLAPSQPVVRKDPITCKFARIRPGTLGYSERV